MYIYVYIYIYIYMYICIYIYTCVYMYAYLSTMVEKGLISKIQYLLMKVNFITSVITKIKERIFYFDSVKYCCIYVFIKY